VDSINMLQSSIYETFRFPTIQKPTSSMSDFGLSMSTQSEPQIGHISASLLNSLDQISQLTVQSQHQVSFDTNNSSISIWYVIQLFQ